jgi:hypothetical protein
MSIRRMTLVGLATLGLVIGACPGTAIATAHSSTHAIPMSGANGGNGGSGGSGGQGGKGGNGGSATVNCAFPISISNPWGGTNTQCTATGGSGGAGGSGGSGGSAGTPGQPGTATCNGWMALLRMCTV